MGKWFETSLFKSSTAATQTQQAIGAIQEVHVSLNQRLSDWMNQTQEFAALSAAVAPRTETSAAFAMRSIVRPAAHQTGTRRQLAALEGRGQLLWPGDNCTLM